MMDVTTPRVLTIRSAYDDAAKEVTLTIADSGPGIPEEIQSRIFEPFFTTKDIGEGTGVGLAVSHRIVEAHEGRSEEHTSELQSLMRISYAVFCLKKKKTKQ